jgi:LysM repeat protein
MGRSGFWFVWIGIALLLSGCFRDADVERQNPTSAPLSDFIGSPSPTEGAKTLIPTLTATPQRQPTNTFPVGGPPIEVDSTPESEATAESRPTNALPPTIAIPSFTPRPGNFGDSGITPTPNLENPPPPAGLITPTGFAPESLECIHIVQPNETLFSIATDEGVAVDEMIAVNPALAANPNALSIGQQLAIPNCIPGQGVIGPAESFGDAPTPDPNAPTARASATTSSGDSHTVAEGDTLFRIATQYGLTVDELIAANPALAANPNALSIGQILAIPTPAGE